MAEKDCPRLTPAQAAELLGVSQTALNQWRQRNSGPPYYRIGGVIRYRRTDVLQWLEEQRHDPAEVRP